jgi:hypothetical protein
MQPWVNTAGASSQSILLDAFGPRGIVETNTQLGEPRFCLTTE